MKIITTHEAAVRLGIHFTTLAQHIAKGKLPSPSVIEVGSRTIHAWTEEEIERARELLPKIANGRKTRHRRKQVAVGNQQLAEPKSKTKTKTQARAATEASTPVPHASHHKKK